MGDFGLTLKNIVFFLSSQVKNIPHGVVVCHQRKTQDGKKNTLRDCPISSLIAAIFKTRNGESENENGERGTGNLKRESLKRGIFKMGNL